MTGTARMDEGGVRDRVLDAALELAALVGWSDFTLRDVSARAGLELDQVWREFPTVDSVIDAFMHRIDSEVIRSVHEDARNEEPRDRLFDVMMQRFEALAPYRGAVRSIVTESVKNPCFALMRSRSSIRSMNRMLEAAEIDNSGPLGRIRARALFVIYADVLRTWLKDESTDMAATMAGLDRRLELAERAETFVKGLAQQRRDREEQDSPAT